MIPRKTEHITMKKAPSNKPPAADKLPLINHRMMSGNARATRPMKAANTANF